MEPPTAPAAPLLRIEAGMHVAPVKRLSTDESGRLVLTVSEDKTARLWSLEPGGSGSGAPQAKATLLRVLRPPVGEGNEGKLYCGVLSSDGALAAVGGWTGAEWDKSVSVYLFDTATGRLLRRLDGLPNVVNDLAFSASGRRLAAGLGEKNGIRVWETASGRLLGQDADYGATCYALDWHGDEGLAATCLDGEARLYELDPVGETPQTLRPKARAAVPGGQQPFSIRFSPDGTRLAVGFEDSTKVAVLNGATLAFQFAPDTTGVDNGSLFSVAWSADGRTLAAGGMWDDGTGANPIRLWSEAGKGPSRDLPASGGTLMDLRPLQDGGFLFAAGDPAWGLLPPGGPAVVLGQPPIADHRSDAGEGFCLSADGTVTTFGYAYGGKALHRFAVMERALAFAGEARALAGLRPPRIEGLPVTDWEDTTAPKLKGQPLKLEDYETSRSLAIAPDASFFLLGADYQLRCYDAKGAERWQVPAPDAVWAVNLSADGSLAVAAYADGTIRWHRADTGRELLAFFPHADQKRWVLWTPEGHFDSSPGAEDLIGWHLNRGKDQAADFFPAAKFRDTFYRPDVVGRVLETRDVAAAVKAADEAAGRRTTEASVAEVVARMQPPVVELAVGGGRAEAESRGPDFTLRYRVRRANEEPVTRLRVLIDGRPVAAELPVPPDSTAEASASVPVPERDCVLSLLAENRFAVSEPATLRLTRAGAPAQPLADEVPQALKPRLYLLAVGVNDYEKNDHLPDLRYAAKDATDFSAVLQKQEGGLYQKVETKLLTDATATAADVLDGLDWLRQQATAKDVAVVFFAGHGENDEELRYYFCPSDYDPAKRLRTGVAMEQIQKTLASIPGKVLFFIDTCHAGNALGKLFATRGAGSGVDVNRLVNELSSAENGAIVFASSTGRQQSIESEEWQNGAFTKALVEGLEGKADLLRNGKISVATLESWVAERVKELSEGQQTPTVAKPQTVPDFPIAVKR